VYVVIVCVPKCRFLPPLCYPLARHICKPRFCPVKETIILRCWTSESKGEELLITNLDLIASLPLTLQAVAAKEHAHDFDLAALIVPLDSFFLTRYAGQLNNRYNPVAFSPDLL
jgi:hypothetical protein